MTQPRNRGYRIRSPIRILPSNHIFPVNRAMPASASRLDFRHRKDASSSASPVPRYIMSWISVFLFSLMLYCIQYRELSI